MERKWSSYHEDISKQCYQFISQRFLLKFDHPKTKRRNDKSFTNGVTVEILSQKFNCIKSTIVRNLKKHLGDLKYKELIKENKNSQTIFKIKEKKR